MQKIVVNRCWGGFGLSQKAHEAIGIEWDGFGHAGDIARDDEKLVKVVESLGAEADGNHAKLKVIEIPDGVEWVIEDYDGMETIHEKHRSW